MVDNEAQSKPCSEKFRVSTDLRGHVSESFNIQQSTMAMIAIFDGFLFSSLINLLSKDSFTIYEEATVWAMTLALSLITGAMLCFHAVSHRVIHVCQFFYPSSRMISTGAVMMDAGLFLMFTSLSLMLLNKEMWVLSIIVFIMSVLAIIFRLVVVRPPKSGSNIVNVD